jgi:ATP synthase protein I
MNKLYNFLAAASFGFVLLLSVVVGLGIGIFLDKIFNTHPLLTIIFTIIGMVSGIYSVFKEIKQFQKK